MRIFAKLFAVSALLATLLLASGANAQGRDSGQFGCPDNFIPIPSGLACQAADLRGPASYPLVPGDDCPERFEYVAGLSFCVAQHLAVSIDLDSDQREIVFLEGLIERDCPPNFSRPVGSTVCTADNLTIEDKDGIAQLALLPDDCPPGFYRPHGVRFCIPENKTSKEQLQATGQNCPPGFARPPGVRFCIPTHIIYNDRDHHQLPPPQGLCPEGWHKPDGVNFCIPRQMAFGELGGLYGIDIRRVVDDFVLTPCPEGTIEIWWDMPVYDDEGLFVVDFIPTRTCISERLQPAG